MSLPQKLEKEIVKLHNKRYRKEWYKYIIEGIICVNELLNAGISPEYAVCTEEFLQADKGAALLARLKKNNITIYPVAENYFRKLVDTVSPQGIFCIAPMKFMPIESALDAPKSKILLLDRMSDPGNLGTIIRSAVAFNFSGIIILSNSVELYNMKVIRSALGSHLHIPILYDIEADLIIDTLKSKQFKLFATVPDKGKAYQTAFENHDKIVVIIGNEHHGIDEIFFNDNDIEKIKIPINPKIESLNAAVCAAVLMAYLNC